MYSLGVQLSFECHEPRDDGALLLDSRSGLVWSLVYNRVRRTTEPVNARCANKSG
jgi:hypothetical protein